MLSLQIHMPAGDVEAFHLPTSLELPHQRDNVQREEKGEDHSRETGKSFA